ncbi:hypothetical protein Tco_0679308 [Tanacetum coccineum]|uniref:Uncharacterized protein n=1 Tax=Tanacetum coccineum TaxID=301880 RepID=A0ABQ4XHI2_9ASTR
MTLQMKPPPLVNFLLVFKLATAGAPPPLSTTTIITEPPAEDRNLRGMVWECMALCFRSDHMIIDRNFAGTANLDLGWFTTAPSSTPLGLGNCYTLTFDPETSQSDEQEDNDSDDGNHEYDVDIYDDE